MTRDALSGDELLHKAHSIGQYYGFVPLSLFTSAARGTSQQNDIQLDPKADTTLYDDDPVAGTIAAFLKRCQRLPYTPSPKRPLFIWHTNIAPGRPTPKRMTIQFHALGSDRAIADTVIIRALLTLVRDLFHTEPVLRINSMGDKETRARYVRELGTFFKKHASRLPSECLSCAHDDALAAVECFINSTDNAQSETYEFANDFPSPTDCLSDASRKRFEDVLEYLELTETSYELARMLLGRSAAWNDLCFEIAADGERVAWGSRYSNLTRALFPQTPFSGVGGILKVSSVDDATVKKIRNARLNISFVHIGDEAKRISIRLAEEFRRAHIPLAQNIGVESLVEQLHLAEKHGSPYLLIMGRKEALEDIAILRNRKTQEETILPLDGIVDRLKALA